MVTAYQMAIIGINIKIYGEFDFVPKDSKSHFYLFLKISHYNYIQMNLCGSAAIIENSMKHDTIYFEQIIRIVLTAVFLQS